MIEHANITADILNLS